MCSVEQQSRRAARYGTAAPFLSQNTRNNPADVNSHRHMANAINSHHNWMLAMATTANRARRLLALFAFSRFSSFILGCLSFPRLAHHNHTLFANVYFNNVAENFYFQFFTSQWSLTSHQAAVSAVLQWESMACKIR